MEFSHGLGPFRTSTRTNVKSALLPKAAIGRATGVSSKAPRFGYEGGRSRRWIEINKPDAPFARRIEDGRYRVAVGVEPMKGRRPKTTSGEPPHRFKLRRPIGCLDAGVSVIHVSGKCTRHSAITFRTATSFWLVCASHIPPRLKQNWNCDDIALKQEPSIVEVG